MGSHYIYKVFRKIKIVKYCKRWLNYRLYFTGYEILELVKLTHQKLCSIYAI